LTHFRQIICHSHNNERPLTVQSELYVG